VWPGDFLVGTAGNFTSQSSNPLNREAGLFSDIPHMKMADWNRRAVRSLLADADLVLTFVDRGDVHAIATARKNYLELTRRRKPLILADAERLQSIMDRLQERIRFFGESVCPPLVLSRHLRGELSPARWQRVSSYPAYSGGRDEARVTGNPEV
jgi:7-keto-8-aminopelargonate synthetase-like enzyme